MFDKKKIARFFKAYLRDDLKKQKHFNLDFCQIRGEGGSEGSQSPKPINQLIQIDDGGGNLICPKSRLKWVIFFKSSLSNLLSDLLACSSVYTKLPVKSKDPRHRSWRRSPLFHDLPQSWSW